MLENHRLLAFRRVPQAGRAFRNLADGIESNGSGPHARGGDAEEFAVFNPGNREHLRFLASQCL